MTTTTLSFLLHLCSSSYQLLIDPIKYRNVHGGELVRCQIIACQIIVMPNNMQIGQKIKGGGGRFVKALLPFHVTLVLGMIYYNIVGYKHLGGDYISILNDPDSLRARISDGSRHINGLRRVINLPHGTFYFGPHSHESIDISKPNNHHTSWTTVQAQLLNDETIDFLKEKQRCESYNFNLPKNRTTTIKRRRLFLGSLIASDSIEVIKAVGMESYNIFHVVSFIESNSTQTLAPREWRFLEERRNGTTTTTEDEDRVLLLRPAMKSLVELYELFGPKTQV